MIRRCLGQNQPQKLAERKGIRRAPCNGALGVQAFKVADQQESKIAPGRQPRSADLVGVESVTERLDVAVEVRFIEDLIESRINGCAAVRGRSCVATHIDVCFGRRRRLPIAMRDSVYAGSIVSILNSAIFVVEWQRMNNPDAADADRAAIMKTTAELLAAVNASDADRCFAVWAPDGVLMPPHHPSVNGHQAIVEYFRNLFSRSKFRFTFTSSQIHLTGDIALERVTYTAVIWPGVDASPIEDVGKGLHVYGRQSDGSWKLTQDIWNSDQSMPS